MKISIKINAVLAGCNCVIFSNFCNESWNWYLPFLFLLVFKKTVTRVKCRTYTQATTW